MIKAHASHTKSHEFVHNSNYMSNKHLKHNSNHDANYNITFHDRNFGNLTAYSTENSDNSIRYYANNSNKKDIFDTTSNDAQKIKRRLKEAIDTHEPRVAVYEVKTKWTEDRNQLDVSVAYVIMGLPPTFDSIEIEFKP